MTSVARKAGVSVAIISRLLRNDPTLRISPQRRRSLEAAIKRYGGDILRQRIRGRRRTRTMLWPANVLFTPEWVRTNMAQTQLYRSIEGALGEHEYRLQFTYFEEDKAQAHFESLVQQPGRCDGLFIGSGLINQSLADLLHQTQFPHVCHDHYAERFSVNTVRPHFSEGLRCAVEHLQQLGHTRIAMLGPARSYRRPMVLAAMALCGVQHRPEYDCVVPELPVADQTVRWRELAAGAAATWLQNRPPVTALVGISDWFVLGFLDAMAKVGLVAGRDLSLVGVDNLELRSPTPSANPVITTVDNPFDRVGRRMAELLINQIEHDQKQIVHERIPAPLIIRQTSGPCSG